MNFSSCKLVVQWFELRLKRTDSEHKPKVLALQVHVYVHDLCFLKLYSLDSPIYSMISPQKILKLHSSLSDAISVKPKLFQTQKLRKRLLLLGIANNVPNWSLDCDLVPTERVGGTPATTRAADEVMADPHHLLQTG